MYLVRHGATEWSDSGRHTGRTDIPLTDQGRAEARALAEVLAGQEFAQVLTSPLVRAAETCALTGLGTGAEEVPDLLEWDYGDYEGRTTPDIRQERPDWSLFAEGVPGGETLAEVGRRADRVVARARAVAGDTLCVAHGHILRVVAARWLGLSPAAAALLALDPASLSVLGWERETAVLRVWNRPPR
jgi:probable phosphoglycerate mutase